MVVVPLCLSDVFVPTTRRDELVPEDLVLDEDELGLDNEPPETRLLEDPVAEGRLVMLPE